MRALGALLLSGLLPAQSGWVGSPTPGGTISYSTPSSPTGPGCCGGFVPGCTLFTLYLTRLAVSVQLLPTPMTFNHPGVYGTLYIDPTAMAVVTPVLQFNGYSVPVYTAHYSLTIPNNPSFVGIALHLQPAQTCGTGQWLGIGGVASVTVQ